MAIILNDNLQVEINEILDQRYGPWGSVALALAGIPSYRRKVGLTVGIGLTTTTEYWFQGGVTDSDLIEKTSTPSGDFLSTTTADTFSASAWDISADTADASDNKSLSLSAGGAAGTDRGAYMALYGNEHATNPGQFNIFSGSTGHVGLHGGSTEVMRVLSSQAQIMISGSAATPAIGWIDTGLYEISADVLGITTGGQARFRVSGNNLEGMNTSGARISSTTPSTTVATLIPNRSDGNTGVGWAGNDSMSIISGGVEVARFQTVGSAVNYIFLENSATTLSPTIRARGTDTNIGLILETKGTTSAVGIRSGSASVSRLEFENSADTLIGSIEIENVNDTFSFRDGLSNAARVKGADGSENDDFITFGQIDFNNIARLNTIQTFTAAKTFSSGLQISAGQSISRVGNDAGGVHISGSLATVTNPVYTFVENLGDGYGWSASGVLEIITGSVSRLQISTTQITSSLLTGTGTEMIVANATGVLSRQAIPSAANALLDNTDNTFSPTGYKLVTADTSDGADSKAVFIGGGGDVVNTRGAYIGLHGNEHASLPGNLVLGPGSTGVIEAQGDIQNSGQYNLVTLNTAPSSETDIGTLGEIRFTADYIYVCTATNTWKRVAISAFPP